MNNIYVFDLDGTLVDSMPYFKKGILSIADEAGINYDDTLIKTLTPLGCLKGAEYYVNVLGVNDTVENIVFKIQSRLIYEYSNNIFTKPGVMEYLKRLYDNGSRLFVLTASPHSIADVCLKHNKIFDLFESVWSVEDFGLSKSAPQIFYDVASLIKCHPCEVNYFDDSLIALENAKKAGFITYGVYDSHSKQEIALMKEKFSNVVISFNEQL